MVIKFQGRYNKKSFFKGVRLANRLTGNQNRFLWFMLFFTLGTLTILIYRSLESGQLANNEIFIGAAVVIIGIIAVVFLRPIIAAEKMWKQPGTRRVLKGEINNQGVIYQLDLGRNEIAWQKINRLRKNEVMVTLVREDGLLMVFPRYFFKKDTEWRKFIQIATKRVQGR